MKRLQQGFLLLLLFTLLTHCQDPKKVSILGDSYSTFEGHVFPESNALWYFKIPRYGTDVSSVNQLWWHQLMEDKRYQLEVNNSFSGSTICNTGYNNMDASCCSFLARMNNLGNPDIIFIFGATNDVWAQAPLGDFQYSDWTKISLYQFRPAMAFMLDYMLKQYPKAKLYFILNTDLNEAINESVKTICKYYQVDCIVLKEIDKIAGHPSIKGMRQIKDQVNSHLNNE
ncbi:SGNH/GDSL hydrolase family protein [Gaetbulibacter sp. M240]|uniref:SGNH/GDSL hydrolase family protein n=1 Tax=Gaetbulibacter sp. M240 TaxID=3126511 RepID=UPI00374E4A1C